MIICDISILKCESRSDTILYMRYATVSVLNWRAIMNNTKKSVPLKKDELLMILDKIDDAIFVDTADGNTLWINAATEELFEIKRENVIGMNVEELEERGIFTPSVAKVVMKSGKHESIVHQNRSKKRILSTGSPIKDENGNFKYIITTSRDITELVNLQNKYDTVQSTLRELEADTRIAPEGMIAQSPSMRDAVTLAKRLAQIDSTVLIFGESGAGKGVIAKLLHNNGPRKDGPFIKINCGAIPETLIETELFGYVGGAFTGGRKEGKAGLFESAVGGTVFLDEISELPLNLQVKLLQVIQEREVVRVGGVKPIPVNVRIISATNKDLFAEVVAKRFREDLYYRLNVVPVFLPPLRERKEDISPLVYQFLNNFNAVMDEKKSISPDAMALLVEYRWPGNVRELQNIVERLMITTKGNVIQQEDIPVFIREVENKPGLEQTGILSTGSGVQIAGDMDLKDALDAYELAILQNAKEKYKSTRAMARALGVTQPTIVRKLQKYGI